jgi:hypothetical protein
MDQAKKWLWRIWGPESFNDVISGKLGVSSGGRQRFCRSQLTALILLQGGKNQGFFRVRCT